MRRNLTSEQKKAFDQALKHAPFGKVALVIIWGDYVPRRTDEFIRCINRGMHFFAAFGYAKQVKVNVAETAFLLLWDIFFFVFICFALYRLSDKAIYVLGLFLMSIIARFIRHVVSRRVL